MAKETVAAAKRKSATAKNPKTKPTKLPSSIHPPYLQMITEAISALKDRTGSSQPAIAKFIEEKYKTNLPPNFKKILSVQLKKFAKSEKLVKVKNSFKISAAQKVQKAAEGGKEKKKDKKEMKKETTKITKKSGARKEKKTVASKDKPKMKPLSKVSTPSALKKKKVVTPKKVPKSIKSPAKRATKKK